MNHTKHVDVCTKFVHEFVEDGILKIVFVKSVTKKWDVIFIRDRI
jgi:hypothetical protein